jgi:4-carboxymuconolactone decarboxylase
MSDHSFPDGDMTSFERGLALLRQIHGGHAGEALVAAQRGVCPDFATMSIEWAMGGIMARPGLDLRTRQLVVIAACVTLGYAQPQLRAHAEGALAVGASRTEIVETILQTLFYAGGAAVANALATVADLVSTNPVAQPGA